MVMEGTLSEGTLSFLGQTILTTIKIVDAQTHHLVSFNGQERFDSKFRSAAQSPHPLVGCRTRYRAQPWAPSRRSGALRVSVDTTIKREAQRTLLKPCSATPPSEPALLRLLRPRPTARTWHLALRFSSGR